jgi:flagellar hook-basal body complex protein FliE
MLQMISSLSAAMPDASTVLASALKSSAHSAESQPSTMIVNSIPTSAASETPFASLMTDAIGQVNKLSSDAKTAVDGLISGSGVDVHQAMIATEKSGMAFEMALAVRNKAVQAYQSVIGMQF